MLVARSTTPASPPTAPERFGHRPSNGKALRRGSHRVRPLEETLARVLDKADIIGLTRLSDLTDLDNLRVPSYAAVCPMINYPPISWCITVFTGKGVTRLQAKVSALMEAAERYSSLGHDRFTVRGSYRDLVRGHNVAHPSSFVVPGSHEYTDDQVTEWVAARSLFHGDVMLVPAWLVFCPYVPTEPSLSSWPSSTNGLASGNTLEEAALHALYEVIERDAEAIARYSGRFRSLDLESVESPEARKLIERVSREGVRLEVKDITQDIKVCTFWAALVDPSLQAIAYINGGKGTHLDPEVALLRAVTEATQSRVTNMAGIREDMPGKRARMGDQDFDRMLIKNAIWYEPRGERCRLGDIPDRATDSIVDDVDIVLAELREAGIPDVYLADLTRPELGIPVARVLVPTLEFERGGNWVGPRLAPFYRVDADHG
jgi:thioglycine synthase